MKAEELKCQMSILTKKADVASKEMEKFFSKDRSFSYQTAFMVNVAASSSQVNSDTPTPSICSYCADLKNECSKLKLESETVHGHKQSLVI
ncbi:hypothetical protein Hanom_Chr11g01059171 [Helianthus anomalus]